MTETNLPGTWRRSSYSGTNGDCVEAATSELAVTVRDSKDPDGPRLAFRNAAWVTFVADVKAGRRATG